MIRASAEALPLGDDSVDAAMAIVSDHHWEDRPTGMRELRRVARDRVVLVNVDPATIADFWLTRDYLTGFGRLVPERYREPGHWEAELRDLLGEVEIEPIPLTADCTDGLCIAWWRRPDGTWARRNADLVEREEQDVGLRLVVAGSSRSSPAQPSSAEAASGSDLRCGGGSSARGASGPLRSDT